MIANVVPMPSIRPFQSIAAFFYLELAPAPFALMSQEALEREIAEMRRQIAEWKAEAARANVEDNNAARS
jgi:hypothetical protein